MKVRFARSVLARQMIVGLAAILVVAIFAHKLIVLDGEITTHVFPAGAEVAAFASAATLVVSYLHLRRHRAVVEAVASGARDVAPEDLARLAALPSALTWRFLLVAAASTLLLLAPGIRPPLLDDGRAAGLVTLTITILAASALPHYVLARGAMLRVMESCP
ncbi:MAG TPA: hypothetical protein VHB21_28500, partial [Minicystis sp.]|nr:hypothetical protein [Minicystis sp.]